MTLFHKLKMQFVTDWWRSGHLYFQEGLPLWNAPFISTHVTDLLPINLISWQMFLYVFFYWCQYFSSPVLLPLFQLLWDMLLPSKLKWANIFHEIVKCLNSFNSWYVLMAIKYGFMRSANHCLLLLFIFNTASQLFWNWGCIYLHNQFPH